MKSMVEPLEGNKVKLTVELEESEFEPALDDAFRRLAREVRIPGFRPGKAPRRLLEAKLGNEAARQEAFRHSLPDFYAKALKETELDAIAPPEIDITSGQETGPVAFDAVVQVRPRVSIAGYEGLQVTIPRPEATDEEIDRQIDRLREQSGELTEVERPARDGDYVTIDYTLTRGGDTIHEASDELYEVGTGAILDEVDEHLRGAKIGDILTFEAEVPNSEPISVRLFVKGIKEKVLPEITDEWASEASEFDTADELRADVAKRMALVKKVQANLALRDEALNALVELVTDDAPEPLVETDLERRVHDLVHRIESQGATVEQWLIATGQTEEDVVSGLREGAVHGVKADLALRSLVEAQGIEATDDEVDAEITQLAERVGSTTDKVRAQLENAEQIEAVRSDVKRGKALEWLLEHVEIVDEHGQPVDRAELAPAASDLADVAPDTSETESDDPAPAGGSEE
ncbi:MAG: trigger factor [Actinomycetota bacterium]|jgi:trigger factor|nr:trigger factor [Actinomycetota bacterium]